MTRSFVLCSILSGLVFSFCPGAQGAGAVSLDAPIELFFVIRGGWPSPPMDNVSVKSRALFLKQLRLAGFHILDDLQPPFVTKAMVHYGIAREGGVQSAGIGYAHLLSADDNFHYTSDSGQTVVLKSNPQSVVWVFERKKALAMADKAGAKYAFVVEAAAQMVYQNDPPQPTYNVSLEADLYQADNGKTVFHHAESMVKLAPGAGEAVLGACQFLSQKIAGELLEDKSGETGK